jgi:hypothetical protein
MLLNHQHKKLLQSYPQLFGDDYKYINGAVYYFNAIIWEQSKTALRRKFTKEFRSIFIKDEVKILNEMKTQDPD